MVFCHLAQSFESALFKHASCPEINKAIVELPRADLFRISFYEAAAVACDQCKRVRKCGRSHSRAAVSPINKEAGDPPIGLLVHALIVRAFEFMFETNFVASSILAPASELVANEDKSGVGATRFNSALLFLSVLRGCLVFADALIVERHAPASAPNTVVLFDKLREGIPSRTIKFAAIKTTHDARA